jgi:hypothetical protein
MFAVRVRRDRPVVFPDRCVRCDGDPQGGTAAVWDDETRWWSYLVFFGRFVTLRVPACTPCRRRIVREQWGKWIVILGGMIVLGYMLVRLAWPLLPTGLVGVVIAFALVYAALAVSTFAWYMIVDRTVELTVEKDALQMEFRDDDYALDVAVLNDSKVVDD